MLSRIEFHYTPKHGSYLNIGEIEINVLDIQSTKRWFEFQEELEKNVKKRGKRRNNNKATMKWLITRKKWINNHQNIIHHN